MEKLSNVQKSVMVKKGMVYVVSELADAFYSIIDHAEYLGQLTLIGRSEWGGAFDKAVKARGVMQVVVDACVRVAKGEIDPRLVLLSESDPIYKALAGNNLKIQKKILDKGVPVRVFDDNGESQQKLIRLERLDGPMRRQCMTDEGIRSLKEQDQFIESRRKLFKFHPDTNPKRQCWESSVAFAERMEAVAALQAAEKPVPPVNTPVPPPAAPAKPEPPKPDYEIKDVKIYFNNPERGFTAVALLDLVQEVMKAKPKVV